MTEEVISKKTVAIVGAGPNGLHAARWALACGLQPTIFEKAGRQKRNATVEEMEADALEAIGGAWRGNRDADPGAMWPGMHTVSNRFALNLFHKYPLPPSTQCDTQRFPDGCYHRFEEIRSYLRDVAKDMDLQKYVRIGHEVAHITRLPKDRWSLKVCIRYDYEAGTNSNTSESFDFDCLIITVGAFHFPYTPDFKNVSSFRARHLFLHARDFPGAAHFEGKRVLVIGGSFTGLQLAAELIFETKSTQVFHVVRRPLWIDDRYVTVDARDVANPRFCAADQKDFPSVSLPTHQVRLRRCFRGPDATTAKELRLNTPEACRQFNAAISESSNSLNLPPEWRIDPNSEEFYAVAIADNYLKLVCEKRENYYERYHLRMGAEVREFHTDGVNLTTGETINDIDAVISCTGYQLDFEFFDQSIREVLEYDESFKCSLPIVLYRGTFRPELPTLAFIENPLQIPGYSRELQARYACYVFSGQLPPPNVTDPEVAGYLEEERAMRTLKPFNAFRVHADIVGFCDALAKDIGALPDFEHLKTSDQALYELLINYPFHQDHYNLHGFGTDPVAARRSIEEAALFLKTRARETCEKFKRVGFS